jgi:hypothetical protein
VSHSWRVSPLMKVKTARPAASALPAASRRPETPNAPSADVLSSGLFPVNVLSSAIFTRWWKKAVTAPPYPLQRPLQPPWKRARPASAGTETVVERSPWPARGTNRAPTVPPPSSEPATVIAGSFDAACPATASHPNAASGTSQSSNVRHGMRIAAVFAFSLLCTAPLASAQKAIDITPSYIAGIHLGTTQAQARALMRKPVRIDRLEDGYVRLVSSRQKLESYFRNGTKGAAVVATWNRQLQTDERIGPCSTVAALRRAYGSRLAPFRRGGRVVAYRLGNLIFTVEDGKRVGVVALGRGAQAAYVALNATECR